MIDIYSVVDGDLDIKDSQLPKAKNLLDVQEGSLEYLQDFGIDLEYFFNPDYQIQNITFENYLSQKFTTWGLNILQMNATIKDFINTITTTFGRADNEQIIR